MKAIIHKHVSKEATVFTDGWGAYKWLNESGYRHFSVEHKDGFKKVYKNKETQEKISVDTNRIECSWQHAKAKFKNMHGTSLSQFEGYLCEAMYRNHHRTGLYTEFFKDLKKVYSLDTPPRFSVSTPLFPTWSGTREELRRSSIFQEGEVNVSHCPSSKTDS